MIHPGECEELPCIAGIYELQLGNSHHIWVFIYAYSYINVKLGHSAYIYAAAYFLPAGGMDMLSLNITIYLLLLYI